MVHELSIVVARVDTTTVVCQSEVVSTGGTGVSILTSEAVLRTLVAPSLGTVVSIRTLVLAGSAVLMNIAPGILVVITGEVPIQFTLVPLGIAGEAPSLSEVWVQIRRT